MRIDRLALRMHAAHADLAVRGILAVAGNRTNAEIMRALSHEQMHLAVALKLQREGAFEFQSSREQHGRANGLPQQIPNRQRIVFVLANRVPRSIEMHPMPAHW